MTGLDSSRGMTAELDVLYLNSEGSEVRSSTRECLATGLESPTARGTEPRHGICKSRDWDTPTKHWSIWLKLLL